MAVIHADVSREAATQALRLGKLHPLHPAPQIDEEEIAKSVRIVAQMGAEPVIQALEMGCRVILCGRCYDPIPFAAPAFRKNFDPGLAMHMGKILECAAIAATPGSGADCVLGSLMRIASSWNHSTLNGSLRKYRRRPTRCMKKPTPTCCPAREEHSI